MPARARHALRVALPLLVSGSLVATALVVVSATSASAAADGTFAISDAPVALNQPSDPEMGVLAPAPDAAERGMFGSLAAWPIIPLHATLARNGHLVTFGTPINTVAQRGIAFDDWDTTAGLGLTAHTDTAAANDYDSFCNSAVTMLDGRILMVSGQYNAPVSAEMMSMLYDPTSRAQEMGANLAYKRWYVTALRLPDSRILLLGGGDAGNTGAYMQPDVRTGVASTPEIGSGTGAWADLPGADSDLFGAVDNHWWYPRAFNGPQGDVVGFSGNKVWSLSTEGAGSVQQTGTLPYNPKVSGSQVMFDVGRVLIAGGGQVNNDDPANGVDTTALLEFTGATPQSWLMAPMHHARNWLNLTVLPNGEVLANGGTFAGTAAGEANSVKQAEVWNSVSNTWRLAATAQRTRTYHSTSLLLPSGAVFTGGGGNPGPEDNFNAEMFYPSYLFTKDAKGAVQWASRPAITSIAGNATYGGKVNLTIGDGRAITSASLISMPSVTHSQNTDQRRVPLTVTQQGGTVIATLPDSVSAMPPGDYELTVVDANGVPSPSQVVSIRNGAAGLVTVAPTAGNPTVATEPVATGVPATGAAPARGDAPVAPAAPGNDPGTGTPVGTAGTGAGTTTGGTGGSIASTVKLKQGATIGIESAARSGYRVTGAGFKATVKKVGRSSSRSTRKASSFIVRAGLKSKKGYSFESVAKPGYYLAAPSDGTGAVTLVKKAESTAFARRATFSAVKGVMGKDVSFRLTATPTHYLRVSGARLVVGKVGESASDAKSATFEVPKGLASRR